MEWYAMHVLKANAHLASFWGAVELIAVAGILIFEVRFKKPEKEDD